VAKLREVVTRPQTHCRDATRLLIGLKVTNPPHFRSCGSCSDRAAHISVTESSSVKAPALCSVDARGPLRLNERLAEHRVEREVEPAKLAQKTQRGGLALGRIRVLKHRVLGVFRTAAA
jgi:hypothetical protein